MGGLGEAISIKLAALGYTVVTTYSPGSKKAEGWLATMREQGYDFKAYECDVADYDSAQACVARITRKSARSTCWSTTPASRAT
jgi:acetoacetyl-CoA reductase